MPFQECRPGVARLRENEAEQRDDVYKVAYYVFICKHSSHLPRNEHMEILILKQSARGRKGDSFLFSSYPLIFNGQHLHTALMGPDTWASVHGVSRLAFESGSGRTCKDL